MISKLDSHPCLVQMGSTPNSLKNYLRYNFPGKYIIMSLTVSSLSDSHEGKPKSRHYQKKAIDILRICVLLLEVD